MIIYIWIVMLVLLWVKWTATAMYNLLLYLSFYYFGEERKFWVKMGKPDFDPETFEIWIVVHLGVLFLASLAMWLSRIIE